MANRFKDFAEACATFSREIAHIAHLLPTPNTDENMQLNLRIARTMFGKWSVDIATLLYARKSAGYQELKNALGGISSHVLSSKLGRMEQQGLVERTVLKTKPPRVRYSLTEKGLRAAKLGEPLFLYLRLTEGYLMLG